MIYSGPEISSEHMAEALDVSGVETKDIIPIMYDFMTDKWWDDPKCISRRIRVCGGDQVRFFDQMKEFGYEFET